ncbi:MAG TPA: DNA-3-methyladenine glycosylase, partial [Longimicrobiales bacterium]|nr:DNA-3-methyladenine glycosylase [Longimicrobiales bacterium]
MKKLSFKLRYTPPYDLGYHAENGAAVRSFWIDGRPVAMKLEQKKANGVVTATAYSDQHIGAFSDDLKLAAEHMIGAEADLTAFRTGISKDKRLAKLVDALPGYKHMRGPDLWTMMLSSLVSQQISGAAARSIKGKLARLYGHVINVDGEDVPVLPSPRVMVELSEAQLREAGFSAKKAEYGKGMAMALLDGTIVPSDLKQMPPEQMIEKLSSLKGVGVWTAECIGIFCLGHQDLLPADDLGIQNAVAKVYKLDERPKPKELRLRGEKWVGWRSWASTYLWAG